MLKAQEKVCDLVARRFGASYAQVAADEALGTGPTDGAPWPYTIALGRPSKRVLVDDIAAIVAYAERLEGLAAAHGLRITYETRIAGGRQQVPTHLVVPSIDSAASLEGRSAQSLLATARDRAQLLADGFPRLGREALAGIVRATSDYGHLDFELLVQAGSWFGRHDARGLTPRQVPLEGFHAKWLDAAGRRHLIELLAGKQDLGLVRRPSLVEFRYLDPGWLAAGGRRYDSHTIGDVSTLPYQPQLVLIVENKDSFLFFEPVPHAICVFGAGRAGPTNVARLPWMAQVPKLFYWGDMDADGLEILDAYRAAGLGVQSILMDMAAFERYERFGTKQATGKRSLASHVAQDVAHLEADERALYELLCSPAHKGNRRIEQERIPLAAAKEALLAAL